MQLSAERPLVLVGAGNMGAALLRGWLNKGIAKNAIIVVDPQPQPLVAELAGQKAFTLLSKLDISVKPQAVVLAVKPQILDSVIQGLSSQLPEDAVVISVAAGRSLASLTIGLKTKTMLIRSMPNLPASVGAGMTAIYADNTVGASARALATTLLEAVGEVVWLESERDIDAATALSGSGPAYVFHLVECLAAAGMAEGLSENVARRLARATVTGAGALLSATDEDVSLLRKAVTSPGGTTEAALKILMASDGTGLQALLGEAVKAARNRAQELSS